MPCTPASSASLPKHVPVSLLKAVQGYIFVCFRMSLACLMRGLCAWIGGGAAQHSIHQQCFCTYLHLCFYLEQRTSAQIQSNILPPCKKIYILMENRWICMIKILTINSPSGCEFWSSMMAPWSLQRALLALLLGATYIMSMNMAVDSRCLRLAVLAKYARHLHKIIKTMMCNAAI